MHCRQLLAVFGLLPLVGLTACGTAPIETPGGLPPLDASAQAQRYDAMQSALEHNLSGQPVVWAENERVRGRIVPIETMQTRLYGWCRDYEERITSAVGQHRLVGIACRTQAGRWLVVRLHPYTEAT